MNDLVLDELLTEYGDVLIHEYDPVARRERYLRTRQLKGRRKGTAQELSSTTSSPKSTSAAEKQKKAEELARLENTLKLLKSKLEQLVRDAKARSGGDANKNTTKTGTSVSTAKSGGGSSKSGEKKLTAKQKADARKRSKEYYDKNKKDKSPSIEEVRSQIKDVQAKIRKMRQQASNETATKGR